MADVAKISNMRLVLLSRCIYIYIYNIYIYITIETVSLPTYVWPGNDECHNARTKLIEKKREAPGGNLGIQG